jgi:hypothetical protein
VPNPYIRRPGRWLAAAVAVLVFVAVWIVGDLIWPGWGEWLAAVVGILGIAGRIVYLRRKFRRDGVPPELTAWLAERRDKRGR